MGKEKMFDVGTYVFAKVRGYPAWPARIQSILDPKPATMKYEVFFFGTSETASVQAKEVFPFDEFKEKYGKPIKRKFFNEGMEELEAERKKKESEASGEASVVTDDTEKNGEDSQKEEAPETKGTKRPRESVDNDGAEPKAKRKASTESSKTKPVENAVDDQEAKKLVDSEPLRKRKKSAGVDLAETGQSKEHTSRSGRVIKPKKFLYDEEEKEDGEGKVKSKLSSSPVPKENVEVIRDEANDVQKKTRKPKAKSEKSEARPVLSKLGRLMWTRAKSGELVQIMIDHDRPVFKSNKSRMEWEENYEKQLQLLQEKIATGEFIPEEVPLQLEQTEEKMNQMTTEEKLSAKCLSWQERKRGQLRLFRLESRLTEINIALKVSLQKNKVDLAKAVALLDELINTPMEALTLKKYPDIVATIKKIKNYIGNVPDWNMTEDELSQFKKNAAELRKKATTVFNKFRNLFAVPVSENFETVFQESLKEFQTLTKDMPSEKVFSLLVDPASPLFKEVSAIVEKDDEFMNETENPLPKEKSAS